MGNSIILSAAPATGATRGAVYLPFAATDGADQVAAFCRLLTDDPRQQRPSLRICVALTRAAAWKAQDIIAGNYWAHQAANGEWPNATVRRFGCALPSEYGNDWNGVEMLAAGSPDAPPIFNALASSPAHKEHLFGENDFFRAQAHSGVAVGIGGYWGWVWCVLIAHCG